MAYQGRAFTRLGRKPWLSCFAKASCVAQGAMQDKSQDKSGRGSSLEISFRPVPVRVHLCHRPPVQRGKGLHHGDNLSVVRRKGTQENIQHRTLLRQGYGGQAIEPRTKRSHPHRKGGGEGLDKYRRQAIIPAYCMKSRKQRFFAIIGG